MITILTGDRTNYV